MHIELLITCKLKIIHAAKTDLSKEAKIYKNLLGSWIPTGFRKEFGGIELERMMLVMIADELILMILTMRMIIVMKICDGDR